MLLWLTDGEKEGLVTMSDEVDGGDEFQDTA
jgi:hypothetical protein